MNANQIQPAEELASDEQILAEVGRRLLRDKLAAEARSRGEAVAAGTFGDLAGAIRTKSEALVVDLYGDVSGRLAQYVADTRQLFFDALTDWAGKPQASAAPVAALSAVSDNRVAAQFIGRLRRPTNPDGTPRERPLLKAIQGIFLDFVAEYGPQLGAAFGPQLLDIITGLFGAKALGELSGQAGPADE